MQSGDAVRFLGVGAEPIEDIGANIRGLNALGHHFRYRQFRIVSDLFKVVILVPRSLFPVMVGFEQFCLLTGGFPLRQQFLRFTFGQSLCVIFVGVKLVRGNVSGRWRTLTGFLFS